jgi:choice-of-anchor A domain-containing protein
MNNKRLQSKTEDSRIHRGNRGFAMPIMMCTVLLLLVIGLGVLCFGQHSRRFSVSTSSGIAARCAADAGVTQALFEMNKRIKVLPWNNGNLPQLTGELLPNTDATYSFAVSGNLSSGHFVKSTGLNGLVHKTVLCSFPLRGLFEYALFGDEYVELKSGGSVIPYNYGSGDKYLQVGTNSTLANAVVLKNGATVDGDAVVGPNGDPAVVVDDTASGIKGNTFIMPKEHDLPQITVPQWLASMPSGGTIKNNKTISKSGKYDKIDLGINEKITIKGKVSLYIVGDVILDNSAELSISNSNDSSLILFVGGNIEVKNGGVINNLSKDSKKLQIYGLSTCQSIVLKNGSDFYGAIYAPNADIVLLNSGDMYGSVIGKSVEQKNSAAFHYDVTLREVSIEDIGVRFVIRHWQEE